MGIKQMFESQMDAIEKVLQTWKGTPEELGADLYLATRNPLDRKEREESLSAKLRILSHLGGQDVLELERRIMAVKFKKPIRETWPYKPHDIVNVGGLTEPAEVISYPCPNTQAAKYDGDPAAIECATIMVRTTPGDPTTITEVYCWQLMPVID